MGSVENRATELGEISRALKSFAKGLRCPVTALSQLNRSVEGRTDKRPMMAPCGLQGALEQDADTITVYLPRRVLHEGRLQRTGGAEIIGKQRNGPTGTVETARRSPFFCGS